MPTEEHMTVNERRKYLKQMKPQYEAAARAEKKRMLSDMQAVTGLHRKSLLRLLNASSLERKNRKTPRQRTYGLQVEQVILQVWESLDYVCAERLTPVLLRTAQRGELLTQTSPGQLCQRVRIADARHECHEHVASARAQHIAGHRSELDIGRLQDLLHAVGRLTIANAALALVYAIHMAAPIAIIEP